MTFALPGWLNLGDVCGNVDVARHYKGCCVERDIRHRKLSSVYRVFFNNMRRNVNAAVVYIKFQCY